MKDTQEKLKNFYINQAKDEEVDLKDPSQAVLYLAETMTQSNLQLIEVIKENINSFDQFEFNINSDLFKIKN